MQARTCISLLWALASPQAESLGCRTKLPFSAELKVKAFIMNMHKRLASLLLLTPIAFFALACGDDSTEDDSTSAEEASAGDASTDTDTDGDGDTSGDGDGEALQRWEVRMPAFSPSANQPTWYSCYSQTFEVPADVHIVGVQPKVSDPHVHHIVAQIAPTNTVDDPADLCVDSSIIQDMLWGWGPGGGDFSLPPEAGFPAGATGMVTIRFQVHYDNPLGDSFVDEGGFDVLYTDQLREFDAGVITFGDISPINIPAEDGAFEYVATCPGAQTSALPGPVNVFASWLHAHEVGSVLWGEIVPAGEDPIEAGIEAPYVFDKQTWKPVSEGLTLSPGDEVRTHCVYDNAGNPNPVVGGEATENEMCINFLAYYPLAPNFSECGSL